MLCSPYISAGRAGLHIISCSSCHRTLLCSCRCIIVVVVVVVVDDRGSTSPVGFTCFDPPLGLHPPVRVIRSK